MNFHKKLLLSFGSITVVFIIILLFFSNAFIRVRAASDNESKALRVSILAHKLDAGNKNILLSNEGFEQLKTKNSTIRAEIDGIIFSLNKSNEKEKALIDFWTDYSQMISNGSLWYTEITNSPYMPQIDLMGLLETYMQIPESEQADKLSFAKVVDFQKHLGSYIPTFIALSEDLYNDAHTRAINTLQSGILTIIISSFLGIICGVILSLALAGALANKLRLIKSALNAVAANDLCTRITIKGKDDFAVLAQNINKVIDTISIFLDKSRQAVLSITSVEEQLSSGVSLSEKALGEITKKLTSTKDELIKLDQNIDRSSENIISFVSSVRKLDKLSYNQSDSISRVSSAIRQMDASVQNVANLSKTRKIKAEEMAEIVSTSGDIINESNSLIGRIGSDISQVFDVMNIISEIASSTDLLAMNAAIEAAHAGEAGRGFSVVAEEIRKLSESTRENVEMISELLNTTGNRVTEGVNASARGAEAFESMTQEIILFVSAMEEISASSHELAEASTEILNSATDLDSITAEMRTLTQNMDAKALETEQEIKAVTEISSSVVSNTQSISKNSDEVWKTVSEMTLSAKASKDSIKSLTDLLAEYKTE